MENALKALIMAAEIIITCIVVAFGFYAAGTAKANAAAGNEAATKMTRRLEENSLLVYDGAVLSGSELLNLLRYELNRMKSGNGTVAFFEVTVRHRNTLTTVEDYAKLSAKDSTEYVSPTAAFKGEAVYRQGTLAGLRFTPATQ
ncbi:MAG: hypothetical protein J6113_05335 [Lachnospiraceae bacterium]|nr:hypothetical protein [Lachnospiraceae bacterium]